MERLTPDFNPNKKELKVEIVRHGPSSYRQPEWSDVETADDLNTIGRYADGSKTEEEINKGKREAVEIIKETAEKIASDIKPDEEVIIWSSPTGRTLETARIISETLQKKGIILRKKDLYEDYGIETFKKLGEVENFSWTLFEPLMNGGEITYGETKFKIDKSLSNPENLVYPEYFTSDAIKNISSEIKNQWPKDYVAEIEKFESFAEVTKRMADVLNKLKKVGDKKYRIIIVTHDALTGDIIKTFTHNRFSGIEPGQLISLERKNDNLIATRIGDLTNKDIERDAEI